MTNGDNTDVDKKNERYQDASLGIFATVSLILLVWGFCWLKSYSALRIPQGINVVFREVAGLSQYAGVFVDGVRVGVVDHIEWEGEHRVTTHIRINAPKVMIPQGSKFVILTNGIVGAKYVEVMFPKRKEGESAPPPLEQEAEVKGEDPVRPEIAVNNIAIGLSAIDMVKLNRNFEDDRMRLVRAADELSVLARKAMPVMDRALPLEEEIISLSKDTRMVSRRLSSFLSDPNLSGDLRRTAEEAKETVQAVEVTMHDLTSTLKDKSLRKDLIDSIHTLNNATLNIQNSVEAVHKITGDKELRGDIKDMLKTTSDSLDKVEKVICRPNFGSDVRGTIKDTRDAINEVDQVAKRLNQMLGKRFPLMRMMLGRPGRLKDEEKNSKSSDQTGEQTADTAPAEIKHVEEK